MSRVFDIEEIATTIVDILEAGDEISLKVNTDNMLPLFRKDKDVATVAKITKPLKKNDIVLYKDENGELSFSRIMYDNGSTFALCGDSNFKYEYNVSEERIVALMISFDKNGKTHKIADKSGGLYNVALPVTKELRKYSNELSNRTKEFIRFLKKR